MSGCDHPPPASKTPAEEALKVERVARLYRYLAHTEGLTVEFIMGVFRGYTLREHVDECHPGQIEEAITKHLETMPEGDERRGYVAGYRFNEGRDRDMATETKWAEQ